MSRSKLVDDARDAHQLLDAVGHKPGTLVERLLWRARRTLALHREGCQCLNCVEAHAMLRAAQDLGLLN